MKYSKVLIDTISYELPYNIVSSADIEKRIEPFYKKFNFQQGQLEAITGISERRYWNEIHTMHEGAFRAGKKAIDQSGISKDDIGMLVYCGVCRDGYEPATACAVSSLLNLGPQTQIYDVSNACLGVLTGMIQVANAIELGQIEAGLVVSCESARQIVDAAIEAITSTCDMEIFKKSLATLTGGSGAVAVLMTSDSVKGIKKEASRLLGYTLKNANQYHDLCYWGPKGSGMPVDSHIIMETEAADVLKNGVELATQTYGSFKQEFLKGKSYPDKTICHQVGSTHQKLFLETLSIPRENDFTTFRHLGNIGTVSLPITAAIASEREFLSRGDLVGFMGIGSGLNCMMLSVEW